MSFSLKDPKTQNLIVGLFSLLVTLWLVMFVIPDIFIYLFDTLLGNLILFGFIIAATMHNKVMGLGIATIFIILFRVSHHLLHLYTF